MTPLVVGLQQAGYYTALLPLVVCGLCWLVQRPVVPDAWLLSAAVALSFFADSIMRHLAPAPNAWVGYWLAPIQYGLLAAIVAQQRAVQSVAVLGILLLALVSWTRGTLQAPETIVRVTGGLMVAWLVWGAPSLVRFRAAVILLTAGTAPWLLLMALLPRTAPAWLVVWGGLQVTRILAAALLVRAVVRPHVWEVTHGPRRAQGGRTPILASDGTRLRPLGGGHRHVMAATER